MEKPKRTDTWEQNLKKLSAWGCVAFAARCAQRVLPLCDQQNFGRILISDLKNTAAIALEAAQTGGSIFAKEEFNKAAISVNEASSVIAKYKNKIQSHSVEYYSHAAASQAITVVHAVVEVTNRVFKNASDYSAHAAAAATFSESASAAGAQAEARAKTNTAADKAILNAGQFGHAVIKDLMWHDLEILCELSDKKQISIEKLGMLWPNQKPSWIPDLIIDEKLEFESGIALEVYVEPGDASKEAIQRVFEAISKLHITFGGTGLEFRADDNFICVRERADA